MFKCNLARLAAALVLGLTTALAAAQDEVIETRYGHVVGKREVAEKNSVPAGAIIGGLVGLATSGGKSSGTKLRRTAGGAVVGGVIAGQADKANERWLYTIRFPGGGEERIVIEDRRLSLGDCAAVQYTRNETLVHYSSSYYCEPRSTRTGRVEAIRADPESDADPCLEARRRLLEENDPEQIELLERKIQSICR